MAERVYPTTKPPIITTPPPATAVANTKPPPPPSFPATKSQLYNASRPTAYRPQQQQRQNHHRPARRSRRCCCCLCFLLTLIILIIISAIAGAVVYFIYSPDTPDFTVQSLKISQFNLTSSSLHTKFNLTVISSNPNDKMKLLYSPISISVVTSTHNIPLCTTTIPAFISTAKNSTTFRPQIVAKDELDAESTTNLKSDMKSNKKGIRLKVEMHTKVKAQIGNKQSYRFPIRILCDGIKAVLPIGKTPVQATLADKKCKVELMIKIWKWTI